MKCAVIIAAWAAQGTIMACLRSIQAQHPVPGWIVEIRLGVDGCNATAAILKNNRTPFYWSRANVGTYVIANSLLALGPADLYSRFDADDFMLPDYLATVIPVALQYGMSQAGYRVARTHSKPRVGQVTMTAETLGKLGGFAEYRCHSDRDLSRRAALVGINIRAMRHDPRLQRALFIKGLRPNSLTHSPKFGCGSKYRRQVRAAMADARAAGQIKIVPKTVEFKPWAP
jgi:hypothetical protein